MTPRRVAFLLPHFRTGGAERVVLNWIGALDRTRYQPVLMLGREEGAFLDLLPGDVPRIALGGGRALLRPLRIARALAGHRIDIAYSATSAMNLALLAAPTRVPRIVSEHTSPGAFRQEMKWPWARALATRFLYRRAAAVAVPTHAIADELSAPRVHVLPNPVVRAVPRQVPRRSPDGARLIAAGRLVQAKGFDTLIDAAALLAAQGVAFTLAIHGDGPLRDDLQARIDSHSLGTRVALMGQSATLAVAFREADLLVSSSRREGFGNVLVEAMAEGLPVLATRAGGPETFIDHGVNGFLAPANDAAALAEAIRALLADLPRRLLVRSAALETARAYDVSASTQAFTALLDTILTPSTAP
ncbi:glycosyltransferase [Sphingomonas xinjiangensis]|uniref:Glycosyltransferase involved in cell wall biosynthesis n=1 Tax=Sphingomonas xinjiangensis TaxID=643568 RepID=A0A840YDR2_9SPHN|nr:glycosyltransferase [Sphingomonas xinjiangensis]MBB5710984.1 glycosyltransferase involved in cell wall biosynthesis [Sphingomonas xinjiangensis]